MNVTFRPLTVWPRPKTEEHKRRGRRTFQAGWQETMDLLRREIEKLDGENIVIQADFREGDIRLDGLPRSNARVPDFPGVIISFESRHGPMQYMTDTHVRWDHNVRAIALGLEALRAVDRYGITHRAEQYQGWKMLTAGSGVTSRQQAITLLSRLIGVKMSLESWEKADFEAKKDVYRRALKRAHPDGGGDTETFSAVQDAGRLLELSNA